MSKVGTVIRCSKCKVAGHNKSSCDKKIAASSSNPGQTGIGTAASSNDGYAQSTAPIHGASKAIVMMSNTDETCSTSKKGRILQ